MRRERGDKPWIIFLVFCCSPNVLLVYCFRLHGCRSSVRSLFGALPPKNKMGLVIFIHLYIISDIQLSSLPHHIWQLTNSFPVSYLAPTTLMTFSFEFPSANQNSLLICCRCISVFKLGFPNYFTLGSWVLVSVRVTVSNRSVKNHSYWLNPPPHPSKNSSEEKCKFECSGLK